MTKGLIVTIRHAKCVVREKRNPPLTLGGIFQAVRLGYHLCFTAGMQEVTILTSTSIRCIWTARIIQFIFDYTIFGGGTKFFKSELLKFSKNDGDSIDEDRYKEIVGLVDAHQGCVLVVTHHQLANGDLLQQIAKRHNLPLTQARLGKIKQGGAYILNRETGAITLFFGTMVEQGGAS